MAKKKPSFRAALEEMSYPVKYKKFSKLFKNVKKSDRRFFIKLLKVYCAEIQNKELVHYASYSELNLNQRGVIILLDDRLILAHGKVKTKLVHFNRIKYSRIAAIDFNRQDKNNKDEQYGALFLKVKRKNLALKNYTIRSLKREDLPEIVEFIKMKTSSHKL
ncbi:PH domain-containing protein [Macrococcus equipercicus]|nr:PH domain-containing protein [Macrococcus equipercicus]UTH13278.1 PH domain-containing protein [Macrococcus equipercicus]